MNKIILASGSPRRKELLNLFNIDFEIIPSKKEEKSVGEAKNVVLSLARQKCEDIAQSHKDCFVIGADTIVVYDNKVIGKPKNREDAFMCLKNLCGKEHFVYTGICIYSPLDQSYTCEYEKTKVLLDTLSDEEIYAYIDTLEPMDKAGSYAIQGIAGAFVKSIDGCASNVIGLPLPLLRRMLIKTKAIKHWLKD